MGVLDGSYLGAVADLLDRQPREMLLPAVLSASCLAVLPVSGAGLSVADVLRVPLGASDETACRAERLQTTLGEGPCLAAMEAGSALVADLGTIQSSWPWFHAALVERTPYRSIASLPLYDQGQPFGALDLYSDQPDAEPFLRDEQLRVDIAGQISAILSAAPLVSVPWSDEQVATWLDGPGVERRMRVWRAVGMLVADLDLGQDDALALLRGYAYAHHQTLDEVAQLLADGSIEPAAVTR